MKSIVNCFRFLNRADEMIVWYRGTKTPFIMYTFDPSSMTLPQMASAIKAKRFQTNSLVVVISGRANPERAKVFRLCPSGSTGCPNINFGHLHKHVTQIKQQETQRGIVIHVRQVYSRGNTKSLLPFPSRTILGSPANRMLESSRIQQTAFY